VGGRGVMGGVNRIGGWGWYGGVGRVSKMCRMGRGGKMNRYKRILTCSEFNVTTCYQRTYDIDTPAKTS